MKVLIWTLMGIAMGGCAYYTTPAPPVEADVALTRGEYEASKARSECRLMARSLLQIARCDGR